MALPLRVGEQVIGALDVQSKELGAFSDDDVTILQTMADQLAVAIENARLLQRVQTSLGELERLYNQYERKAWQQSSRQQPIAGYFYNSAGLQPLLETSGDNADLDEQALEQPVLIPLQVRNVPIGSLEVWPEVHGFLPDEKDFLEEIGVRISQAMESARLFEESQSRAMREETINLVSSQVRSSIDMETVLQNTVREIGKALGASRTFIQLGVFDNNQAEDNQAVDEVDVELNSTPKSNGRGQE